MPPEKGWPALRQWPAFAGYALRAVAQLGLGRYYLGALSVPQMLARNKPAEDELTEGARRHVAWVSYTVPRIARIVPWRSDCLVQALAAQHWLARADIGSEIEIGVERPQEGGFGAHAWLRCGTDIVTGGSVDRYTQIV